jgi:Na+/H+-dicarboxylate symporter
MLGNGLVISGARTQGLSSLVRQINTIGLLMADWVSRCVPYFTVALICYEILSREAGIFRWLWQALLLALMVSLLCMLLVTLGISRQQQVSLSSLTRKLMPAFAKAIKTGGLDAGFGDMQASCVKDLGVERHYVEIGLPMGMTLYMPITVVGIYIFTIYAAVQGNVAISAGWLVVAGILAVVMSAAAPPVPGASLLTYMMLFSELGIPEFMLISAMVFDILFGIFASAANQTMLQLDLIRQADQIGLLDKECLRRS